MSAITAKLNGNIYFNDVVVTAHYTETIKKLEDEGSIELKIVDATDFYTLYILFLRKELTDAIRGDLEFALTKEKLY